MNRDLPPGVFAAAVTPTLTITRLAAQTAERLAVLDRVRPILSDAIQQAEGYEAVALVTSLGVRIMQAILRGE